MKKSRRKYTREFKLEAVKMMMEQGRTAGDVEKSLGVGRGVLYGWKSKFQEEGALAFPGNGRMNAHEAELRELRRELERTRQERDILKKATAYFARESRSLRRHQRQHGHRHSWSFRSRFAEGRAAAACCGRWGRCVRPAA